jgi:hypothetical protein
MILSEIHPDDIKPKKTRPREPAKVGQAMQKRLARFMAGKITKYWLEEWFDELSPRDKSQFIQAMCPYVLVKPAPKKDIADRLTDEEVNQIYERLNKHS